jgi:hypothetical protein
MKILRVYLDTSVIGGCFDKEFQAESSKLIEMIRLGIYVGMISPVSIKELALAPKHVQEVTEHLDDDELIRLSDSVEADRLTQKYLDAGIVSINYREDAGHIAFATVNQADVLVSWNFRHIVNLQKIEGFNRVNEREGYPHLEIRSPKELIYGT